MPHKITLLVLLLFFSPIDSFRGKSLYTSKQWPSFTDTRKLLDISHKHENYDDRTRSLRRSYLCMSNTDVGMILYDAQLTLSNLLESQLLSASLLGFLILFSSGLLSSISPCSLSLVPLTSIYLIGTSNKDEKYNIKLSKSVLYAFGLATPLTIVGLFVATFGGIFTTNTDSTFMNTELLSLLVGLISFIMGLNLLDIVPLSFPSLKLGFDQKYIPWGLKSYLFGISSALIASPCSSPILASVLAIGMYIVVSSS
jgi:cytochrome c biogenesis protein CcdA